MRKKLEGRITIRLSKAMLEDLKARARDGEEDVVSWARKLLTWGLYANDAKVALGRVQEMITELKGKQDVSEETLSSCLTGVEEALTGVFEKQDKLVEVVKRLAENLETLIHSKRERAI